MSMDQSRLKRLAITKCLPCLLDMPAFKPYLDRLSFVLVGSVATGLAGESSDIDIAIVCDKEIFTAISGEMPWDEGRPSEMRMNGIQLHYYAIMFDSIENKLRELDDVYFYVYGSALILRDPTGRYKLLLDRMDTRVPEVRRQRLEGKLDMLMRRCEALRSSLVEGDIVTIGRICLELITLCLKVTALLDDIPFDPRKRLFRTALRGRLGKQVESKMYELFSCLGTLGKMCDDSDLASFAFPDVLSEVVNVLSKEASRQGFRVGLESPDRRHIER